MPAILEPGRELSEAKFCRPISSSFSLVHIRFWAVQSSWVGLGAFQALKAFVAGSWDSVDAVVVAVHLIHRAFEEVECSSGAKNIHKVVSKMTFQLF